MRGSQLNFVDAFVAFRDWEKSKPEEVAQFIDSLDEEDVAEFTKSPTTANLVRDLAFAYFRREQFPTHSALVEQILYNQRGGIREREESDRVGKLLRSWSRDGEKGKLFDGIGNIRIDGRVAHFELGQIPEHATEMRAAANFLVANYGRQKIISMPRSMPKIAIFEEASRTLDIPGGVRMIQEYYRQMRKFGCNILAVVQQYDVIKNSPVRGAVIGNSKRFLKLKFQAIVEGPCRKSPSLTLVSPIPPRPSDTLKSARSKLREPTPENTDSSSTSQLAWIRENPPTLGRTSPTGLWGSLYGAWNQRRYGIALPCSWKIRIGSAASDFTMPIPLTSGFSLPGSKYIFCPFAMC